MTRLLCLFPALLMVTVVECGDYDDSKLEAPKGATPSAVPQAADAGTQAVAAANDPIRLRALPDNFPEDVPVYGLAEILFSRASADFSVSTRLVSDESPETVTDFYADDFAAKGWSTEIRETPEGTLIIADKLTRKAAATVTVNKEGRTQLDMVVTEIPK
jgi:hypothetical protein